MLTDWTLREEVLRLTQRWPEILLAFLVGSLMGWTGAYLYPSLYRAETSLSVAYSGDAIYRNPDDFKNWYLEQLDTLTTSDDVLEKTVLALKDIDPQWQELGTAELRQMVRVAWRNTGTWRLVVHANQPEMANQVLEAWSRVVQQTLEDALSHARQARQLEADIRVIAQKRTDVHLRKLVLEQSYQALQDWQNSPTIVHSDIPLGNLERWQLQLLAARIAGLDAAGRSLVESIPPTGAAAPDYLPWVEQILASIETELPSLSAQETYLAEQLATLSGQWSVEFNASRALSGYFYIEPLVNSTQPAEAVRAGSTAALIGGLLGLIAWAFYRLVGMSLGVKR